MLGPVGPRSGGTRPQCCSSLPISTAPSWYGEVLLSLGECSHSGSANGLHRRSPRGPNATCSPSAHGRVRVRATARVFPARGAERCVPGAPCFLEPRSVVPSRAIATSGFSGAAGRLPTTLSAQAPRWALHSSRCTRRKIVWSVAAQGGSWVKPRAWASRTPSLRPHAAMAL